MLIDLCWLYVDALIDAVIMNKFIINSFTYSFIPFILSQTGVQSGGKIGDLKHFEPMSVFESYSNGFNGQ